MSELTKEEKGEKRENGLNLGSPRSPLPQKTGNVKSEKSPSPQTKEMD